MVPAILFALIWQTVPTANATATVRGQVVADDNGAPVKYAFVQLIRVGAEGESFTTSAGAEGTFEIRGLAPGTYFATADKLGFLSDGYSNNSVDSGQVTLSAGQVFDSLNFRLTRAAVISGTITDTYGDPVPGASVQAMVKRYWRGRSELTAAYRTESDDHGEYRLYSLAAGRYYVRAVKGDGPAPLAATLFPNAARMEEARTIAVKAGEERQGINLTLAEEVTRSISGRVVDAEGQPIANAPLDMHSYDAGARYFPSTRALTDGTFQVHNLAPGHYRFISCRDSQGCAVREVDLTTADANDLIIKIGPGGSVKGRIKAEGGALPSAVSVGLSAPGSVYGNGYNMRLSANGTFHFEGVPSGPHLLWVEMESATDDEPPTPFYLSSVSAGGKDVMTTPFEVVDSGSVELSATIDLRPATVSGKVLEAAGADDPNDKPVSHITVALLSSDPKTRLIRPNFHDTQSSGDGRFKLSGLAPGDYLLAPWPGADPHQLLDPELFEKIEKLATRITLERGQELSLDLHLTKELRSLIEAWSQ
jgi:protocatechuate 3,4-dioxygenase beta subunit